MNRIAWLAAPALAGAAAMAHAQVTPAVLTIDFTSATVPLSPMLTAGIALMVAVTAGYLLRRRRVNARLATWLTIGLLALPSGYLLTQARLVSDARAIPVFELPLSSSPTVLSGNNLGLFAATNALSVPITIVNIRYNTGGYDYYIDDAETTCLPGTPLAPGDSCLISIRSLG